MAVHVLMEAIKSGRSDLVLQTILRSPDAVTDSDCNGTTPVILAARVNNEAIVRELLSHGGDPEAAEIADIGANTALHFAARNKNESLYNYWKPYIKAKLLDCAVGWQLRAMVACLLSFGASPNKQNALGQTPLHIAARVGCKGAVEQMLGAGANAAITDMSGFDAAYWAEHGKYSDLARLLPPPKCLNSKELALFQLLTMDQLGLTMKNPSKKKGKGKKK